MIGYVLMIIIKKALVMEVILPCKTPEENPSGLDKAMVKNGASHV